MKYLKSIQTGIVSVLMLLGFALTPLQTVSAAGSDVLTESCKSSGGSALCTTSTPLFGTGSLWMKIINMLIFLTGAIAVVMIVIGGIRYTTSAGDSSQVNSAKNTILYSVVGLVIAASAYGIVNFVLSNL